jgi:hypothetical protein
MTLPALFRDHFQTAYVVRNLDGAIGRFRDRLGVAQWHVMPLPPGGPVARIGLAWVQELMIELIEALPDQPSIYQRWVPETDTAARFHHHGFLIDGDDDYQRAAEQFTAAGYAAAMSGSAGDILDFHYADTVAELGHYCELVHLRSGHKDFFAPVPRN